MSGIDQILDTAKKGLFASKMAIEVAGHNIANVNTPGFSRQRVTLATDNPIQYGPGMLGTGVVATQIQRVYDRFINEQINQNETLAGKWKGISDAFLSIEGIFNEADEYGLNNTMNEFWNAWQDLSINPEGQAERTSLLSKSEFLASNLRQINEDLSQSREELDIKVASVVQEINSITGQIAELNEKIAYFTAGGQNPNDLMDQRDLLLRELSSKVDIDYFVGNDGKLAVFMADTGNPLVENLSSFQLELRTNIDGVGDIYWKDVNCTEAIVQSEGELGGLIQARDVHIKEYARRVNELASAIIFEVNNIHSNGVGLNLFDAGVDGACRSTDGTLSGLDFGDRIEFSGKEFTIWIRDDATETMQKVTIDMSAFNGASTLNDLADDAINGINSRLSDAGLGGALSVLVVDNALQFQVADGYGFGFSEDTSHALAALGINTFFSGSDAQSIGMNDYISDHPEAIAAGRIDAATGEFAVGDNSNARAVADLQNQAVMSGQRETFDQYYASLVEEIGIKVRESDTGLQHQALVLDQLDTRRQSISGVSIDEEMISLMKFQQAYMASSKMIQQADELIEIIMDMVK